MRAADAAPDQGGRQVGAQPRKHLVDDLRHGRYRANARVALLHPDEQQRQPGTGAVPGVAGGTGGLQRGARHAETRLGVGQLVTVPKALDLDAHGDVPAVDRDTERARTLDERAPRL